MSNTVPEGWQIKKLGNLVDPRSSNVDKKTYAGEIPVRLCNYTDVYYRNRITSDIEFMEASAKQREIDRFSLEKGDVIITKDSETPGDIAVPAYVSEDLNGVVCGYHLTLLKPMKERSDGEFLSHLFQFPSVQHYFYILANGITRFGLTADAISEAPLLAPPLPEQQKIAAILSSVDDVIEKTRAQIDKLKDLKTGMMQELLTKGIGHTAFKDSPVGRIPEGWDVVELTCIARVIDCKHATPKYFNEGYPVVKPGNIKEGNIDLSGCSLTDKDGFDGLNENHKPCKGDTVYSRNQTYGIGAFVHEDVDFAIGQDVCVIHPTDCEPKFIFYAVNAPVVRDQVELLAAGSTFKRINLGSIRKLLVPVPGKEEQKRISLILSSVDRKLLLIEQRLSCVKDIKKALMQDLLTGKVRVNVDNKETAVA